MRGLPEGWASAPFGEVNAFNAQTIDPSEFPVELFELYSVPTFPSRKPELLLGREIGSTKQLVGAGDVLVCKINPRINRVWVVGNSAGSRQIASSEWMVLRQTDLDSRYLRHFFASDDFRELLCTDLTGVGGSLTRAQPKRVATYSIPIAPLQEQHRIADKLDAVLARVDAARARLQRVPALLKRFRQSVLEAATSGALTEDWRTIDEGSALTKIIELDQSQLEVPATWDAITLTDVIDPTRPLCYGVVQPGDDPEGGVPLIRVQDMHAGNVLVNELRRVSLAVDAEYRRSRVRGGDLLISVVGTIGRTAIVPPELVANIARAVARIACKSGISSRWINIWLSSDALQWYLLNSSKEVARKTLNLSDLAKTPVGLPPGDEQHEIVRRVEALFALADRIEARQAQARARLDRLTPALLAKAFRGELVPQDPADEPAAALLQRLRASRAAAPAAPRRPRRATP